MRRPIETPRMRLVPSSAELVRAEIEDHERFGRLLGACVPAGWPPGEAADALPWFLEELTRLGDEGVGWYGYYCIVVAREPGAPVLVGGGGTIGLPVAGEVEIGYSLLPEYYHRGYATEMMAAVLDRLTGDPGVQRVIAETDTANEPSQRVLERLGFARVGTGREPNSLRFARDLGPATGDNRAEGEPGQP